MKKKQILGIIAAAPLEACRISRVLNRARGKSAAGLIWYNGRIGSSETVCVVSGIGKTNAAHATTLLIGNFSPSLVVNFGVGGAYPSSGLNPGDIAVASKEVYADEGVLLRDGFHTLELIGIPFFKRGASNYFNEFPVDAGYKKDMITAAVAGGFRVREGIFATVSTCTGTKERAGELSKRFGAVCESMEGAAIAHNCLIHKVPFVEVRGISNIATKRDTSKWEIRPASLNCQEAVIEFLLQIGRG